MRDEKGLPQVWTSSGHRRPLPVACPGCGAIYAKVEASLARGDTIHRAAPAAPARARLWRKPAWVDDRAGLGVSLLIAVGFSVTILASLAAIAMFALIMTAPGNGGGKEWNQGFSLFLRTLLVAWACASVISLVMSLLRRPAGGIMIGILGAITIAVIYGAFFDSLLYRG